VIEEPTCDCQDLRADCSIVEQHIQLPAFLPGTATSYMSMKKHYENNAITKVISRRWTTIIVHCLMLNVL